MPLQGLRVVDFGQMIAVPILGQWLARLGAEVILIESRANLPSRALGPFSNEPGPNTSAVFNYMNRNKRSCTLNLRKPEGVGLAKRLVAASDVVMENFSPGTMDRLGLGYEALRGVNPDLVMLSLSAFGATGPWRSYSALHSGVLLLSGLAAVTGYPYDRPRMVGSALPDPISGVFGLLAVVQGLRHRTTTGKGQHIDLAMTETVQTLFPEAILERTLFDRDPERIGNGHRRKVPHGVYRTRGDDAWVALSVGSEGQWKALCAAMGRPDLLADESLARGQGRRDRHEELDGLVETWLREREAPEAVRELQKAGVPAAQVLNERDVLHDPHLSSRNFIEQDRHPEAGTHRMGGVPWRFHRSALDEGRPAPMLGDGNEYVLGSVLGIPSEEITRLECEEVIY